MNAESDILREKMDDSQKKMSGNGKGLDWGGLRDMAVRHHPDTGYNASENMTAPQVDSRIHGQGVCNQSDREKEEVSLNVDTDVMEEHGGIESGDVGVYQN